MAIKKKYVAFAQDIIDFSGNKIPDMKSDTYKSVRKAESFSTKVSGRIGKNGGTFKFHIERVF